jgi:nitrogen fixation protein NifU and related proteins
LLQRYTQSSWIQRRRSFAMPERGYDDLIMDHIRNARNYRVLESGNRSATGHNPLCGDEITLHLDLDRERLQEISFQCTACGIAMASASIMTELVKSMTVDDARALVRTIVSALQGNGALPDQDEEAAAGPLAILATVRAFPSRTGCAVLPWATLEAALDGREDLTFAR